MKPLHKKLISLLTGVLFAINQFAFPAQGWAGTSLASSDEVKVLQNFQLQLPPELGTIHTITTGAGPTLIHIQTAHGNYEAQQKIQGILKHLKNHYGIKLLFLEGSAFKLKSEFLRFYPSEMATTMKVLDQLTQKAIVKGAELFLAENEKTEAYGIEDLEAYVSNGNTFKDVLVQKEKTDGFIQEMDFQIERLTAPYLNKDLRHFLKRLEGFENGQIDLTKQLDVLKGEAQKHLEMDLEQPIHQVEWPMLVRIFKLQEFESKLDQAAFAKEQKEFLKNIKRFMPSNIYDQIESLLTSALSQHRLTDPETGLLFEKMVSHLPRMFDHNQYPNVKFFIGHLILRSEVKGEKLFGEIEQLKNQISFELAENEEEKRILTLLKDHRLLKRLFALELTPEDYEQVIKKDEELYPSEMADRFLKLNRDQRVRDIEFRHLEEITQLFDKALEFYQGAKDRDRKMIQNIENRLKETGENKAVVITGGFHAGPFENYFKERDYNYALIAPNISAVEGHDLYVRNFLKYSTIEDPYYISTPRSELQMLHRDPVMVAQGVRETILDVRHQNGISIAEIKKEIQAMPYFGQFLLRAEVRHVIAPDPEPLISVDRESHDLLAQLRNASEDHLPGLLEKLSGQYLAYRNVYLVAFQEELRKWLKEASSDKWKGMDRTKIEALLEKITSALPPENEDELFPPYDVDNAPKVAVIIPIYNRLNDKKSRLKRESLIDNLRSLTTLSYPYGKLEIIIIDNGSPDVDFAQEIKDKFPEVRVLRSSINLGFAGGNNLGIQDARERGAEYFFLVNDDAYINDPKVLTKLVRISEQDGIGFVGMPLANPENKVWRLKYGLRKPPNFKPGQVKISTDQYDETNAVAGSALLVNKKVIDQIGLMDDRFFLYWEETDWNARASRSGLLNVLAKTTRMVHKEEGGGIYNANSVYYFFRNSIFFSKRNFDGTDRLYQTYIRPFVVFYRFFLELIRGRDQQIDPSIQILHHAIRGLADGFRGRWESPAQPKVTEVLSARSEMRSETIKPLVLSSSGDEGVSLDDNHEIMRRIESHLGLPPEELSRGRYYRVFESNLYPKYVFKIKRPVPSWIVNTRQKSSRQRVKTTEELKGIALPEAILPVIHDGKVIVKILFQKKIPSLGKYLEDLPPGQQQAMRKKAVAFEKEELWGKRRFINTDPYEYDLGIEVMGKDKHRLFIIDVGGVYAIPPKFESEAEIFEFLRNFDGEARLREENENYRNALFLSVGEAFLSNLLYKKPDQATGDDPSVLSRTLGKQMEIGSRAKYLADELILTTHPEDVVRIHEIIKAAHRSGSTAFRYQLRGTEEEKSQQAKRAYFDVLDDPENRKILDELLQSLAGQLKKAQESFVRDETRSEVRSEEEAEADLPKDYDEYLRRLGINPEDYDEILKELSINFDPRFNYHAWKLLGKPKLQWTDSDLADYQQLVEESKKAYDWMQGWIRQSAYYEALKGHPPVLLSQEGVISAVEKGEGPRLSSFDGGLGILFGEWIRAIAYLGGVTTFDPWSEAPEVTIFIPDYRKGVTKAQINAFGYPERFAQKAKRPQDYGIQPFKDLQNLEEDFVVGIDVYQDGHAETVQMKYSLVRVGAIQVIMPSTENFGKLYGTEPDSLDRFKQEWIMGLAAYEFRKKLGIPHGPVHINETATFSYAIGLIRDHMEELLPQYIDLTAFRSTPDQIQLQSSPLLT